MSQQNVEVHNEAVRTFFSAFEDDTDAFRDILHPEIQWYPIEENRTPTHGVEAAMWNRNQWLDTWEEHRLDLEEVIVGVERSTATITVASVAYLLPLLDPAMHHWFDGVSEEPAFRR